MTEARQKSRLNMAVGNVAEALQAAYLGRNESKISEATARGVLAELRRHAGQKPEKAPIAFERALTYLYPALLSEEPGRYASYDEEAAFLGLTLFALHMQSATRPMHIPGRSFAHACGLMSAQGDSKSLKPRFDAVLTATNYESQVYHARSLVTLLRSKDMGFDYGAFAQDLKSLRNPSFAKKVLLRWGRDFAAAPFTKAESGEPASTVDNTLESKSHS